MKFIHHPNLRKRIGLTVMACMLVQLLPTGIFSVKEAYAATDFRHVTVGDSEVLLGGKYIEVGISKSGSFGTTNKTADFHSLFTGIGLSVDGDGFDQGTPPTTGDFFLPGAPEEGFTVGYKPGSSASPPTLYTNAERMGVTQIPMETRDTSSGDTLSAVSSGTTDDANLDIAQKITFKENDKFFKNTLTYTNKGTTTLYDVRYMRSFDPDQDTTLQGTPVTYNTVLENFPQDSRAIVRASGYISKEPVFFISTDSRARASAFGFSNRNPYDAEAYLPDGSLLKKGEIPADQAIAITFALGDLAPGMSVSFEYYTSLDPSYESGLEDIMGSLGLQINAGAAKTNSLNVALTLNGTHVKEMCFSNDGLTYSAYEPYTASKAWTLSSGKGTKTVYAKFRDNKNNESILMDSIDYNAVPVVADASVTTGFETSYSFVPLDFTADGKFADADGDALSQIRIAALPLKGVLKLKGNDVALHTEISAADLSSLIYVPNPGAYGADSFQWTATDGADYSVNKAVMTIAIRPGAPDAPEKFILYPANGQMMMGGNPIKLQWSAATSNSGNLILYKLDFFDGSLWTTVYHGPETSYEFSGTLGKNTASAKFRVSAVDAVGNSMELYGHQFMIDSTMPAITSVLQTPTTWTAGNVTLSVEAKDILSGLPEKPYSFDGGMTWQANGLKTFEENTDSVILVRDSAGNIQKLDAISINNIDKVAPTGTITMDTLRWKEILSKITFGLFFKENLQVTITAEDASSGIRKVEYAKSSEELDLVEIQGLSAWTTYAEAFTVTATDTDQFIFYVKLTDNAGNISYLSSNGVIFDTTAPGITGIIDKETYYVDQIVTVSDLYLDTLMVNGVPFESGSSLPGDKDATYTLLAKDKAGNPTSFTVTTKTIASLDDRVEGLTEANVKSSDKAEIEAVLLSVEAVIATTHNGATADQIEALENMKQNLEKLLKKIQEIKDLLSGIEEKVKTITLDNLKKEDLDILKPSAVEIEEILVDFKDNLTDDEKDRMEKKITFILEMVKALNAVIAVEDQLKALPDLDNLHKTDVENLSKAGAAYDGLNDHQKSLVEPLLKTKYENLIRTLENVLLEDPKTGTAVEGIEGNFFNLRTMLVVTPILDALDAKTKALFEREVLAVAKGKQMAELYQIQLLLDGKPVQPDGKISITLKVTEKMKSFKALQVVYVTEDGTVTIIPSEQHGDEIVFMTDHLSYYGVIGTPADADTYPQTGDGTAPISYYFLGAASLLFALVLLKKSKQDHSTVE